MNLIHGLRYLLIIYALCENKESVDHIHMEIIATVTSDYESISRAKKAQGCKRGCDCGPHLVVCSKYSAMSMLELTS